jgi:hypothetical protein
MRIMTAPFAALWPRVLREPVGATAARGALLPTIRTEPATAEGIARGTAGRLAPFAWHHPAPPAPFSLPS